MKTKHEVVQGFGSGSGVFAWIRFQYPDPDPKIMTMRLEDLQKMKILTENRHKIDGKIS